METIASASILRLRAHDNVAVALKDLPQGGRLGELTLLAPIARGHKLALTPIPAQTSVIKYDRPIAVATRPIAAGEHVHTHNTALPDPSAANAVRMADAGARATGTRVFQGIVRPGGRVATRNYVGILTTVNCSATVARAIADRYRGDVLKRWPGVDGVIALTHAHGCAMGHESDGMRQLRRTLAGYARHPNFAGVLMLGLGCESNTLTKLMAECGEDEERLLALDIQTTGGAAATVAEGCRLVERLLDRAANAQRQPVCLSHLVVGLQCGGSDGFSGISANPALGYAADLLVRHGAAAILSETPEIYGADHLLTGRAVSAEVADKLKARLAWWEEHVRVHGGNLNDNPSAGNLAGGITNIVEKSLGAVAKAGTSPLMDVLPYAAPLRTRGLVFMDSPGYDPVSVTGQVATGANLIAFTTGRGSTFGCKPSPSVKIASNSALFERMKDDMDVDCGDMLDRGRSVADKGEEIFETLLAAASGQPTASERFGFGEAEFAPWTPGVVT